MLIQGVDLPEELLRAQAAGDLVVFAGAGVSEPRPSSLPLFDELAERVGQGSGQDRNDQESVDWYFGRLKAKGIEVHKAVAQILINDETLPHELHRLLIQLFPADTPRRIVTTNFDTHFSTAVQEAFGPTIEIFYAPALPLGDDFAGLVYLHGSAAKAPEQCVLTDEDFGRAYLTRAWATTFLTAMFARYAVLFVGYSHADPVMNYLARGLSKIAQKPRYAFTTDDPRSLLRWNFLGVHPLIYSLCDGDNQHQAITQCVRDWTIELHRGLLEKAGRIRAIAEAQPPLEGEDADYMKFSLGRLETARVFFRYARTPEWISWLERHGFLRSLFDLTEEYGEFQQELAFWLTEHFLVEHAQDLLSTIQRNGVSLRRQFCSLIWRHLIRKRHDPRTESVFSLWTAVLLMQYPNTLGSDDWAMLLSACSFPADSVVSSLIFTNITRPALTLKPHLSFFRDDDDEAPKVAFELNLLEHSEHYLSQAWDKLIQPNLAGYVPLLGPAVIANLAMAHSMMELCGRAAKDTDPFWFHRQSIAPHREDSFRKTLDYLIDAAREIVAHRVESRPADAMLQINDLFASDIPILKRLAVYSLTRAAAHSADEKLQWLVQHDLLYRYKTDVFRVLELNYPSASLVVRRLLTEAASTGPTGGVFDRVDDDTRRYEVFNLFVWLKRAAPDCELVNGQLDEIRKQNPEFLEREQPEVDFSFGGARWLDAGEQFNIEEIVAKGVEVFLEERPDPTRDEFGRSRSQYCSKVSAATAKTPLWGLSFLRALNVRGLQEPDLWSSVCQGWHNGILSPQEWKSVLTFSQTVDAPREFFETLAEVLEHGSTRESDSLPSELMNAADIVAKRIWSESLGDAPAVQRQLEDWLSEAINRPGGKLAEFWLQRLSTARQLAGDSWTAIPSEIGTNIVTILHSPSGAAAHARVIFASQLHYFFSLDPSFARAELLPLFDWSGNEVRAEQCWHGFLTWGRWLPGFVDELLPKFDDTVGRASKQPDGIRRAIITHVTALALFRITDPLSNGWLPGVVRQLNGEDLASFASRIDHELDGMDASETEALWERWLKRYWQNRLLGMPKPLSEKEAKAFGCWALSLGRYFPEAVALVGSLRPPPLFEHVGFLSRIDSKGLAREYPADTADLMLIYLSAPGVRLYVDDTLKRIWQALLESSIDADRLTRVREAMFKLGVDPQDWTE